MRRILSIVFIMILLLVSVTMVGAEDISSEDINLTDDNVAIIDDSLDEENYSHVHSQASDILEDVVKATTLYASGGSYTSFKSLVDSAASGSTIVVTGDYTWNSGFPTAGITINKDITIEGNGHTFNSLKSSRLFIHTSGNFKINNANFINGHMSGSGQGGSGGVIRTTATNSYSLTVVDCTFVNNSAATYSGVIHKDGSTNIFFYNCTFINSSAATYGGVFCSDDYGGYNVFDGCAFIDNRLSGGNGGALSYYRHSGNLYSQATNCAFVNNRANGAGDAYLVEGGYTNVFYNNWYGSNNPVWSSLTGGLVPTNYVVMNVTAGTFSQSGGPVTILTSLDTVYNTASGVYSKINETLVNRTVVYTPVNGTISPLEVSFHDNVTGVFNYPSGIDSFGLNVTIDNQVFVFGTSDVSVDLILSIDPVSIGDIFNVTIHVTNLGPVSINYTLSNTYVDANFLLPSLLQYRGYTVTSGSYNNTTGLWNVGDLIPGASADLVIKAYLPYNTSFVGNTITFKSNISGVFSDWNSLNNNKTYSIIIQNKSKGSYIDLQRFIDDTASGGILYVPFEVEYDPAKDSSLIDGMVLNKSITLIGNGHNISGKNLARIFRTTANNVNITDLILLNASSGGHGGAIQVTSNYVNILNCTFMDNKANSYWGGGVYLYQNYGHLLIANSTFLRCHANYYGGFGTEYGNNILITQCTFINNTENNGYAGAVAFYSTSGYAILNSSVLVGNRDRYNHAVYGATNNDYNWWGTNTPNFSEITTTTPTKWIVMNLTSLNPINTINSGTLNLETSLNTVYDSSTGNFTNTIEDIPYRTVIWNASTTGLTKSEEYFKNTSTNTFTYPAGTTSLQINATIDNQILSLQIPEIIINITNVTKTDPAIGDIITFTIDVTNNAPFNIFTTQGFNAIILNITTPYPLIYRTHTAPGIYDNTTNLWYVGNLSSGQTKTLKITVKIPFNTTLIGTNITVNASLHGGQLLTITPNNIYDNITIELKEKLFGYYTDLQEIIDYTPTGGIATIPFNIIYEPTQDAWLKDGMRLNKTITINGNGLTINGSNQARNFIVTANNIEINNITFINAIADYGGSIKISSNYVNITNCTFLNHKTNSYHGAAVYIDGTYTNIHKSNFINNTATGWGGGVYLKSGKGNLLIANSTFINNYGDYYGGFGTEWGSYNVLITQSLFINNTENHDYAGAVAFHQTSGYTNATYNVFIDNPATNGRNVFGGTNINNNWWGSNNPNFSTLSLNTPETWIIMNFTNTTPITNTGGISTLLTTLDTIFNKTNNSTTKTLETIPTRTVYYNWTTGNINPNTTTIQNNNTTSFNYPNNMGQWKINATIDKQTLWLGSTDLGIHITSNKNPINDGDNITINITIINNGIMPAYDVNISINFPYGLIINNHTNNTGIYNNTTNIWHFDVIYPNENFTISFNATLKDPGPNLLINATITNNTSIYEENTTNNTYLLNLTVIQWSDLEITKNISNPHPKTKENITYTITVTNHGPSTANNVTVFDNLSNKLILQYYNSTNGNYNDTTGIWFINNITPNSTETLNITVLINESGITENYANVSCPNNDTNWTNNHANITFETAPLSDLWVTINMEPQTSNFITFHIQAGNNGIEPANGTIVELNISNLMIYVNHTTDAGVYGCSTGVWDIGYISVNQTVNLTLIVQLDFPAGLNVTNITTSVNITSWSTDLYPENNTDNITFEAEIFGNFRLLQRLIDEAPANTIFVLPRSFAYDPINDAFIDGVDTYDLINGVSINKNLTIVNPEGYTIGGFKMARCLNITAHNVILDGLKIADGYSPLGAGLNIPANNVQILRSNFTNNVLWGDYGGAIYISGNNVLIQGNYFEHNNASKLGGAIGAIKTTNLKIISNTFINNTVESDRLTGGAIGIANSTNTNINYNVFLDNKAPNYNKGNIIYIENTNANIEANWYGTNNHDFSNDDLIYII